MAVVGIEVDFSGKYLFECSGTLIHNRVVLSARHCPYYGDRIRVGFGTDVNPGGDAVWIEVSEVWRHPGGPDGKNRDMALLRLAESPPDWVDYIPHLPYRLRVTESDIGTELEYVGFGLSSEEVLNSYGVKMATTNSIKWVCSSESCSETDSPAKMDTFCQEEPDSGIAGGDSGGPAFIRRSGVEYVAGIASYIDPSGVIRRSCHIKVDEFEGDILGFIGRIDGASCAQDQDCDSGICEDGVCCNSRCTADCTACNVLGFLGNCVQGSDGDRCYDGDYCNGRETWQNCACVSGPPLECDDQNPCTIDTCIPSSGCEYLPVEDGNSCSDTDVCNGEETCVNGYCHIGVPLNCDDGDPCTTDSCDSSTGCQHALVPDGGSCDDGNLCTDNDVCTAGVCVGSAKHCDDDNSCTRDVCRQASGCEYVPVEDGTSCSDMDACNGEETCRAGICCSGSPPNCDDGNSCTTDRCDSFTGCQQTPVPYGVLCDDGDPCTDNDVCTAGACIGTARYCGDNNPCTKDSCDESGECVNETVSNGSSCSDNNICNGEEICVRGECLPGTPLDCDDNNPCTVDSCDPASWCVHSPLPDGYECGQGMMCYDKRCVGVPEDEEAGGCNSSAGSGGLSGAGLILLGLLMVRVRRFQSADN